jgi:Putative adhesin
MRINRPVVVLLVALLLLLAGGCSAREPDERPAAQPTTTAASQPSAKPTVSSFPAPEPIKLDALMEAGKLRIDAGPHKQANVVVRPTDPERAQDVETAEKTVARFASGTLTVKTPRRPASWDEPGSIDVRVVLPERSDVKVRVSVADVEATGQLSRADLESSTGDLRLDEVTGAADLQTAAGDVSIAKAGLLVQVLTASGNVRLGAVWQGLVIVQGTAGDVHIGVPSDVAAWQDLDSLGGQVRSTVQNAAEADAALKIQVHTTGGDIEVVYS